MSARLVSPAFVSRRVCSCRRCGGVSKRPRQRDLRAWGVRARHATGAHQDLRAAVERQVRAPPRRVVVRSRCRVAAVRAALREALRAACGWPPSTRGPRHGRWCDRAQRAPTRCARRARGLCSTHRGATMRYLRSDRSGPSTALRLLLTPHGDHARGGCILAVGPVIDDDQLSLANKPIARTGVPLPALMVVEDGVADVLVGDSIADARSAAWSVNKTRIGARIGSQGRSAARACFPVPLSIRACGFPAHGLPMIFLVVTTRVPDSDWCHASGRGLEPRTTRASRSPIGRVLGCGHNACASGDGASTRRTGRSG
jgi:hypothetical protein